MSRHTDPDQLAWNWQRRADAAAESGETALFALGLDSLCRDGFGRLLALQRIARRNLGLATPLPITGGDGWLWLLATLVWQPDTAGPDAVRPSFSDAAAEEGSRQGAPAFPLAGRTVVFGGDSALYAATLNIAGRDGGPDVIPVGLDWSGAALAGADAEGSETDLLRLDPLETKAEPAAPGDGAETRVGQAERLAGGLLAFVLLAAALFG